VALEDLKILLVALLCVPIAAVGIWLALSLRKHAAFEPRERRKKQGKRRGGEVEDS